MNSLGIRLVSALFLLPPVLGAVYFGRPWFEILVGFSLLLMAWEWSRLVGYRFLWLVSGLFYLVVPAWFLVLLRADADMGRETVFWLMFVVFAADTGAYLAGSLIGGPKLAPAISPKKTWAGLGGALVAGALVGWGGATYYDPAALVTLVIWGVVFAFVGQMGDLLESAIKRRFGVKDTSRLIPGHGGILDRVDALLAVGFVAGVMAIAGGGSLTAWL